LNRWYEFRAQAKGAEILIYDEIGAFGIAQPRRSSMR
jgi:hypothetical protein